MGSCSSRSSRIQCQTTKIILSDGSMKEIGEQITAEEIILQNPGHFLCDADSLYIDQYVVPVNSEEELEMGQLYFLLPLPKLQYVLSVSDMAAMLHRANSAIRSTGCRYNWKFPTPRSKEKADWVAGGSGPMGSGRKAAAVRLRRLETIHETLTS